MSAAEQTPPRKVQEPRKPGLSPKREPAARARNRQKRPDQQLYVPRARRTTIGDTGNKSDASATTEDERTCKQLEEIDSRVSKGQPSTQASLKTANRSLEAEPCTTHIELPNVCSIEHKKNTSIKENEKSITHVLSKPEQVKGCCDTQHLNLENVLPSSDDFMSQVDQSFQNCEKDSFVVINRDTSRTNAGEKHEVVPENKLEAAARDLASDRVEDVSFDSVCSDETVTPGEDACTKISSAPLYKHGKQISFENLPEVNKDCIYDVNVVNSPLDVKNDEESNVLSSTEKLKEMDKTSNETVTLLSIEKEGLPSFKTCSSSGDELCLLNKKDQSVSSTDIVNKVEDSAVGLQLTGANCEINEGNKLSKTGGMANDVMNLESCEQTLMEVGHDNVKSNVRTKKKTTRKSTLKKSVPATSGCSSQSADLSSCSSEEQSLKQEKRLCGSSDAEEGSWDSMFNDSGDCLDPKIMNELGSALGKVSVQKPQFDYWHFQPHEPEISNSEFGHVVEICDFPAEFKTDDLISALSCPNVFEIKWVDDTHALAIFESAWAASEALAVQHRSLKVRPLTQAALQCKLKAEKSIEFLQPYKPRPETSASIARRLVSQSLGLRLQISQEQRELERKKLKEAKDRRKQVAKQKKDVWEGSVT